MASGSSGDRRRIRGRANRPYRGSNKRVRQLNWLRHTPPDFWILLLVIVAVLAAIAWSLRDPPPLG
jgi:hypothetical protein